ncbi:YcxB family protein [Sporolactobacillus sp. STCC-11]|uniref:YcxB family protein n=1 Tax=Sporolactobacillus caesalpiniae TaxID=3230362 RepID=UPI003397CA43
MSWIPSLTISLIIAILTITLIRFLLNFRIRKEFQSDQVLKKDAQFIVYGSGVTILRRNSKTQYSWNDIFSFQQYKELFLLYVSKKTKQLLFLEDILVQFRKSNYLKQLMATNLSKKINNK